MFQLTWKRLFVAIFYGIAAIFALLLAYTTINWVYDNPGDWEPLNVLLSYLFSIAMGTISYFGRKYAPETDIFLSKFTRKYLFQVRQDRFVDTSPGERISSFHGHKLEDLYIELRLVNSNILNPSSDPLRKVNGANKFAIWDLLRNEDLKGRHFLIASPPGRGKTTLLRFVAFSMAQPWWKKLLSRTPLQIPILILIRSLEIESAPNLTTAIKRSLESRSLVPPPGWIESHLSDGRFLIMFDGLDEVSEVSRSSVESWLKMQIKNHQQNQFIVTTRPHAYTRNIFSGFSHLEIRAFSDKQKENYIHNWYKTELILKFSDSREVRKQASKSANKLIEEIRKNVNLNPFTVNPLFLYMITKVYDVKSSIPERKVTLYEEFLAVFLSRRHTQILSAEQRQKILQSLAYHMQLRGLFEIMENQAQEIINLSFSKMKNIPTQLPTINIRDVQNNFLQEVINDGILKKENEKIVFIHRTFQEFLAAAEIDSLKEIDKVLRYVNDPSWREVFIFYSSMQTGESIIRACLTSENITVDMLELADICDMSSKNEISPEVKSTLGSYIEASLDSDDLARRSQAAETLLRRRIRQMNLLEDNMYIDSHLISNAEYQLFLESDGNRSRYPDHWLQSNYPSGKGKESILGIRHSDALAFCDWLTKGDPDGWLFKLPTYKMLAGSQSPFNSKKYGTWLENDKSLPLSFFHSKSPPIITIELLMTQINQDLNEASIDNSVLSDLGYRASTDKAMEIASEFDMNARHLFDDANTQLKKLLYLSKTFEALIKRTIEKLKSEQDRLDREIRGIENKPAKIKQEIFDTQSKLTDARFFLAKFEDENNVPSLRSEIAQLKEQIAKEDDNRAKEGGKFSSKSIFSWFKTSPTTKLREKESQLDFILRSSKYRELDGKVKNFTNKINRLNDEKKALPNSKREVAEKKKVGDSINSFTELNKLCNSLNREIRSVSSQAEGVNSRDNRVLHLWKVYGLLQRYKGYFSRHKLGIAENKAQLSKIKEDFASLKLKLNKLEKLLKVSVHQETKLQDIFSDALQNVDYLQTELAIFQPKKFNLDAKLLKHIKVREYTYIDKFIYERDASKFTQKWLSASNTVCWATRIFVLVIMYDYLLQYTRYENLRFGGMWKFFKNRHLKQLDEAMNDLAKTYITLAVIEQRRSGYLKPFEGILLTKEL